MDAAFKQFIRLAIKGTVTADEQRSMAEIVYEFDPKGEKLQSWLKAIKRANKFKKCFDSRATLHEASVAAHKELQATLKRHEQERRQLESKYNAAQGS